MDTRKTTQTQHVLDHSLSIATGLQTNDKEGAVTIEYYYNDGKLEERREIRRH